MKVQKEHVKEVDLRRELAELQVPASLYHRMEALVEGKSGSTESHGASDAHGESASAANSASEHGGGGSEHGGGGGEHGGGGGEHGGAGGAPSLSNHQAMDYAEIVVYLTEKTKTVLKGKPLKIEFAKGGGAVDLAQHLNKSVSGEFFLGIEAVGSATAKVVKAYFLSDSPQQRIGNDIYGMGCGVIADISDFYKTTLSQNGVKLTSKRSLHVHQAAGNYVILFQTPQGAWRGGQITIKDSSRPQLVCNKTPTAS